MSRSVAIPLGLTAVVLALAVRASILDQRLKEQSLEVGQLAEERSEARSLAEGFLRMLETLTLDGPDIVGQLPASGRQKAFDAIDDGVVYLLRTHCPVSRRNLTFLDDLYEAGATVVGIAPGERKATVALYSEREAIRFPLLAEPDGRIIRILPGNVVPVTALILEGRIAEVWLGELRSDRRERLRTDLGIPAAPPKDSPPLATSSPS